jgi:hypothetical protein
MTKVARDHKKKQHKKGKWPLPLHKSLKFFEITNLIAS